MKFKILINIFVLIVLVYAQSDIDCSRRNAITRAIEDVGPAVAGINVIAIQEYVTGSFFDDPLLRFLFPEQIIRRRVQSLGSGFIISSNGYIVTNAHVIENAEKVVVSLVGGREFEAKIVGVDNLTDIALLKIDGKNFKYAKLGDSDDIIVGEWVVALGNPFGLFNVAHNPVATVGIVSGVDIDFGKQESGRVYQDMIQTDASINAGNSGGPLVNVNGEVIGINTFIFTGSALSEGSIGIGFAIPINRVKVVVEELKKYGKVDRSFRTGLTVQDIDVFLARYLGLEEVAGVIVTNVKKGSSAEKAGIKIGDILIQINNRKIKNKYDIIDEIQENFYKRGDIVKFVGIRDGKRIEFQLVLE
ncbi:MAG: trypsin-like peptidase domain-containing protein [Candidatus Marinimicrobia bacterium]|nr:trypsin-like peptidase domain-containing protein [Candidatus Neomarinimicrobiota bacterium]